MKTCPRCGITKPYEEYNKGNGQGGTYAYCKPCAREYTKQWDKNHPEAVRKRVRRYNQEHPDRVAQSQKEWRERHPGAAYTAQRRWLERNPDFTVRITKKYRDRNRHDAFMAYGGFRCACCGETEPMFLTIDHIENDGNVQRREIGSKGGSHFFTWLRQQKYPPGFQVLCRNCNWGKHANGGVCPHQSTEGSSTIQEGSRAKRPEARSRQHQADEIVSSPSRGGAVSGTQPETGTQLARRAEHEGTKSTICVQGLLPLGAGSISRKQPSPEVK
jgi:hypothetical protein